MRNFKNGVNSFFRLSFVVMAFMLNCMISTEGFIAQAQTPNTFSQGMRNSSLKEATPVPSGKNSPAIQMMRNIPISPVNRLTAYEPKGETRAALAAVPPMYPEREVFISANGYGGAGFALYEGFNGNVMIRVDIKSTNGSVNNQTTELFEYMDLQPQYPGLWFWVQFGSHVQMNWTIDVYIYGNGKLSMNSFSNTEIEKLSRVDAYGFYDNGRFLILGQFGPNFYVGGKVKLIVNDKVLMLNDGSRAVIQLVFPNNLIQIKDTDLIRIGAVDPNTEGNRCVYSLLVDQGPGRRVIGNAYGGNACMPN